MHTKNLLKTLFRTGEATFNKYIAKPSGELFEKEIDIEKLKRKILLLLLLLLKAQVV
jgi:hypothetical protein